MALRRRGGIPPQRLGAGGSGGDDEEDTEPARAEALWRNAAASTQGHVHYIEETPMISAPGTVLQRTEVWMAPGVKRTRISGFWLEERRGPEGAVLRRGAINDMISVTLGPGGNARPAGDPALRVVREAWRRGRVARSFPAVKAVPVGTFLIRRGERGLTVEHVSPLFFSTLSAPFDPKTITERFARSGGAKIEEVEGTEQVRRLLIGGNEDWRYRITIDRESRRLVECSSERRDGASWVLMARSRFDNPASFPPAIFDPVTIRR
ncbi:hypothetical protein EON77_01675 [bacterium]|nr:MAG: hypothetical protein EON77_01675 [bacterium]